MGGSEEGGSEMGEVGEGGGKGESGMGEVVGSEEVDHIRCTV